MLTVLIFWNRKFSILELLRKSPDSSSLTCNFNVFVSYDLKQFFEKPSFLLQKNLSAFFKKKGLQIYYLDYFTKEISFNTFDKDDSQIHCCDIFKEIAGSCFLYCLAFLAIHSSFKVCTILEINYHYCIVENELDFPFLLRQSFGNDASFLFNTGWFRWL